MRVICCIALLLAAGCASVGQEAALVRNDQYVTVTSTAPGHAGKPARLYVREVVASGNERPAGVVLFLHGSGTPGYVGFDVPYKTYSWMGYLARGGYAVYAVDLTGYGRSTRPQAMGDACNVVKNARARFVPTQIAADCKPSQATDISTIESDVNDIDAVVEHLRRTRGVDKVHLLGWSQGGVRSAHYALRHPQKVASIFMLAPSYARDMPAAPRAAGDGTMGVQSQDDFHKLWAGQTRCEGQVDPEARAAVWKEMIASDPDGAKWGPGVRRAPVVQSVGCNREAAARLQVPYAMVAGTHDGQVHPERVQALYKDLASRNKVFVDLGCSSHNAMWEKNHLLLFAASLEWLRRGTVEGISQGEVRMGYERPRG